MKPIEPDIHVPAPLRDLPIFLCWRLEPQYEGDPKPLKVPYYPSGGRRAGKQGSGEDRAKLTTYALAKAQAAKRGMTGVGIALLDGYDIVAVDVDNCVVDGKVPEEILEAVGMTYSEYSPSGRGIRALFRGDIGNRKAPTTLTDYGFEVFSTSGYVTLTGNMLDHVDLIGMEDTLQSVTPKLLELCERRFGAGGSDGNLGAPLSESDRFWNDVTPTLGLSVERMEEALGKLDPDMGRDEWIRVGMALHHETKGDDTGFELWDEWSAPGSTYPGTEGLRVQWESFTRREGSGRAPITMATVLKMAKEAGGITTAPTEHDQLVSPSGTQRFNLLDRAGIMAQQQQEWLIKGLVPKRGLGVVFGPSQSGKSFLLLDMLAAIGRGAPWFGHRVKQAHVTYVMLEGEAGLRNRVVALERQHEREIPPGFRALVQHFDLSDPVQVEALGELLPKGGVTAIDTLNRSAPGLDENAAQDMGKIIGGMKRLQELTEGLVICVHHTGKDATKGMRGHSSLHAALDMAIEVGRGDVVRWWKAAKVKDGADDHVHAFKLKVIELGVDEDGDPITSCAIEPDHSSAAARRPPKGKNQKAVYARLRNQLGADGWTEGDGLEPPEISHERALALAIDLLGDINASRPAARAIEAINGLISGRHLLVRVDGMQKWLSLN